MTLIQENYGAEKCNRESPSGEITWICDHSERWTQAKLFVGGLIGGTYVPPLGYPGMGSYLMVANDVSIHSVGTTAYLPAVSRLTVSYGMPECKNPSGSTPYDIAELSVELTGQGFPIPRQSVRWGADAPSDLVGQPLREGLDIEPYAIVPEMTYSIRMKYCTSIAAQAICSYIGCINASSMAIGDDTFGVGKVLFVGYSARQHCAADGGYVVEREFKFAIQCAMPDWNTLVIPDRNGYAKTNWLMYRSANLNALATA